MADSPYNSNDGFRTKIWGPMMWAMMHMISMNYPVKPTEEDKRRYMTYFYCIQYVLPCGSCRTNLQLHMVLHPLQRRHLKNRHNLSKWVYDLHCRVNETTGKKNTLSFNDVRNLYELFRARCSGNGCTEPSNNIKTRCVIHVVPDEYQTPTIFIDDSCLSL